MIQLYIDEYIESYIFLRDIYIYTYTHTHTHTQIYIHTYIHTYILPSRVWFQRVVTFGVGGQEGNMIKVKIQKGL